jgi:MFS family permease
MLCSAAPALVSLACSAPMWTLILTQLAVGAGIGFFGVVESYTLAERVPSHLLSRVDSVNRLGSTGLRPVGMGLIGPTAVLLGMDHTLLAAAAVSALTMAVPLVFSDIRGLRRA